MKFKHITLFAVLAIISITLSAYKIAPEPKPESTELSKDKGIEFFHGTYKEALALAKKEKKPIFIDIYTVWCGPCKMMSNYVFTQKEVGDYYNENFINFKIDAERGEGPAVARKFRIRAYPTLLFIDGNGQVLKKAEGARGGNDFIKMGETVIAKTK
ncbi:MAG: thioredoxin family protein [Bacteroidia bacterium]